MEASLKELAKLEKLAANSGSSKGKSPCITDSLDSLLQSLREAKEAIQTGTANDETFNGMSRKVDATKKDIDERQKEVYNSLARFGKALDKVCDMRHCIVQGLPAFNHALVAFYSPVAVIPATFRISGGDCSIGKDDRAPFPAHRPIRDGRDLHKCQSPHFLNTACFGADMPRVQESGVEVDSTMRAHFLELHQIVTALKAQNIAPALQ